MDGWTHCWDVGRLRERGPYAQFLQATAAALIPLEARLAELGVSGLLTDWAERSRSSAIERDLAGLGCVVRPCTAPTLATTEEQFGALYVLEGSRLGGAMIAREVAQSEDALVLENRRYLGHGAAGRLWQGFVERLERIPGGADLERVCIGAHDAFALFETAARRVLSG